MKVKDNVLTFSFYNFNGFEKTHISYKELIMSSCEISEFIVVNNRRFDVFFEYVRLDDKHDYICHIINVDSMLNKKDLKFLEEHKEELTKVCKQLIEYIKYTGGGVVNE